MKKKEIILIGGGGHCNSCIDVIEQEGKYLIHGILDTPQKQGDTVLGYKIIGNDNDLPRYIEGGFYFLITMGHLGNPERRNQLYEQIKEKNGRLATIISPIAYVSKHAKIGEGSIIMHHSIINTLAKIGDNCIINTKALIEHDAKIGNNCHISTASIINGGTEIGENTFFGSGATCKQYIKIPNNSFIKANSVAK